MQRTIWLLLSFLFVFSACRKDLNEVSITTTPYVPPILAKWEQPEVPVTGSLTGFVVDENGTPVADAQVTLNGMNTTTDRFGHFFYKEATLNARGSLVRVNKAGYFPGSRRFFAVEGTENRVKIQLIPLQFNQSFSSANGDSIVMNGDAYVVFPPNAIARADGTPYEGEVRVATYWLDPDDERITDQMPGNLQGVDNQSQEVVLQTAGMMAVELQDEIGQPLNLLEGYTATIAMPVPDYLGDNPPAEVPNWSYNEQYGMWVEEGVSRLDNGYYIGEVSHFSYWNHDFKDPLVEFSAIIQNEAGEPLEDIKVVIRQPGTDLNGFGRTGADGSIAGLIPQNYDLLLEVKGLCDEVVYSENVGPFADNVDLGIVTVDNSVINLVKFTGNLVNCDGDPVVNGLVIVESDTHTWYEYLNSSTFSFTAELCGDLNAITVTGVNTEDLTSSMPTTLLVTGETVTLGEIAVCGASLDNYIQVTIDNESFTYFDAEL
ncbi:MAG TPA: carboxypeptidase-like regulatory domain-containing protein, partial [Phaeodactylibacter sp.]|nr:carboxypeptidase-like regulatory domain-containing protein [Phaeodactylibacter sp.]